VADHLLGAVLLWETEFGQRIGHFAWTYRHGYEVARVSAKLDAVCSSPRKG